MSLRDMLILTHHETLQISGNGFISMGAPPTTDIPNIPGTPHIISPYGNNLTGGIFQYTDGFLTSHPAMERVSSFIAIQTKTDFIGTRMMIVEWIRVSL